MIKGIFEWYDIGNLNDFFKIKEKNDNNNVEIGNVYTLDTQNTNIYNGNKDQLVVVLGNTDMNVINCNNVILVSEKDKMNDLNIAIKELEKNINYKKNFIEVGMNKEYFLDVGIEQDINEYFDTLDKNKLLIFSPTSIKKIKIGNEKIQMKNWHNISKNKEKIDKYIESINNTIDEVITFGGGSVIDIGKYIAYKLNIKCTCIPSMLSTNSFATNKVAIIENGKKITLDAKMPDKIIIDNKILKLSEKENLYGLADVLSIYTALYDWKIANEDIDEKIDENIYKEAEKLLVEVMNFINTNSFDKIIENNLKLFEFIGKAGYITNLYGTGRPESGSEHILAKEIESKIDIPHGMSVSIGILIMSLIQDRYETNVEKAIMKMKIFENNNNYGLTKEIIKQTLLNVKVREDRYTVINRNRKSKEEKIMIVDKVYSVINEVEKNVNN